MKENFEMLNREVISKKLCTHCGTCVGICPYNCLAFNKDLYPILSDECRNCGLCYENCPGKEVDFQKINKYIFNKRLNIPLGNFNSIYAGRSKNEDILKNAASGGAVTSLLVSALTKKLIDGAIVISFDKKEPYKTKIIVARTADEIISAGQSKYTITPTNSILKELKKLEGRYAIVALPCQVHALRKMQMNNVAVMKKIKYIIGIYCGNNLHYDATKALLKRLKIKEEDIEKLEYRGGKWPGNFKVTLKDGTTKQIPKFHYNYIIPLYMDDRCKLCFDFTNFFADISVGDLWGGKYEKRNDRHSLIIIRTSAGKELMQAGETSLLLKTLNKEDALTSHKYGFNIKKQNFIRAKRNGINYNVRIKSTIREVINERIFNVIFNIGKLRITKTIISIIPLAVIGRLFVIIRLVWRKLSNF